MSDLADFTDHDLRCTLRNVLVEQRRRFPDRAARLDEIVLLLEQDRDLTLDEVVAMRFGIRCRAWRGRAMSPVDEYRSVFEELRVAWPQAHSAFKVVAKAQLDLACGGPIRNPKCLMMRCGGFERTCRISMAPSSPPSTIVCVKLRTGPSADTVLIAAPFPLARG